MGPSSVKLDPARERLGPDDSAGSKRRLGLELGLDLSSRNGEAYLFRGDRQRRVAGRQLDIRRLVQQTLQRGGQDRLAQYPRNQQSQA